MRRLENKTMSLKRLILSSALTFCVLGSAALCFAEELGFEVSVDRSKISLGSSLQLSLTFDGAQDVAAPDISSIDGFQVRYLGPSTRMSIVNGKVSSSVTHNYVLFSLKTGNFKIGPFKFEYNGNTYTSNQLGVEVLKGPAENISQPDSRAEPQITDLNDRLFVVIQTKDKSAYVNEIVPITVKLYINNLGVRDIQYPEFSHEGFSAGVFNKPAQYKEVYKGINFDVVEFNTSIFGLRPGEFRLGPAHVKCNLITRKQAGRNFPFGGNNSFDADIFGDFFGRYEARPLDLQSGDIPVTVLSLPGENKPGDFSGALGNFDLEAAISPLAVKVGDPVTLTMVVSGEGNFSTVGVPRFESEQGFKIYEPQVKQAGNQKSFERIIMPMNEQIREIPRVSFFFFDPQTGGYKTITRGPFPITIVKPDKEEETKIIENEQRAAPAIIKEEKLGRDIVYIKDNPGRLRKKGGYLYKNKIFLVSQAVPLLIYLFTAIIYRRQKRFKTDLKYARQLLAPRKARAGIRQAQKYLDKTNAQRFYDALFDTIQEYLGDKFHLPSKGITAGIIDEQLRQNGVEEEILVKLRAIFRDCDMVRYASSQLTREDMRNSLNSLEEVIDYFQRKKI
ncbi:MAG: BatD family protein [Candidatus Omnitrophica bacterium]|nr:BatD family protein [Candidatus Omnitrophota bacterium]